MPRIAGFFRSAFRWITDLVDRIRHGDEDMDAVYPDRHKSTPEQAATNASLFGGGGGGFPGGGF